MHVHVCTCMFMYVYVKVLRVYVFVCLSTQETHMYTRAYECVHTGIHHSYFTHPQTGRQTDRQTGNRQTIRRADRNICVLMI